MYPLSPIFISALLYESSQYVTPVTTCAMHINRAQVFYDNVHIETMSKVSILRLEQNGWHFAGNIFKYIL